MNHHPASLLVKLEPLALNIYWEKLWHNEHERTHTRIEHTNIEIHRTHAHTTHIHTQMNNIQPKYGYK